MQGGGTEPPTKPKGRPRKVRPGEQTDLTSSHDELCRDREAVATALDLRARVANALNAEIKS